MRLLSPLTYRLKSLSSPGWPFQFPFPCSCVGQHSAKDLRGVCADCGLPPFWNFPFQLTCLPLSPLASEPSKTSSLLSSVCLYSSGWVCLQGRSYKVCPSLHSLSAFGCSDLRELTVTYQQGGECDISYSATTVSWNSICNFVLYLFHLTL